MWNTACFSIATVNCGDIGHVTLMKTFKNLLRGSGVTGGIQLSIQDLNSFFAFASALSLLIGWGACQDARGGFAVMNLNRGRV